MEKQADDLIAELCRQERAAQRQALQLYGERVFSHVARIVPCREDAEEVYHDVWVKVFRHIRSYDPRQAAFPTWLCRIAYHEAISFMRRGKPPIVYVDDCEVDLEYLQDEPLADSPQAEDEETLLLLERAIGQLPPHEQALITMFYFDGTSIADIAYITDSLPNSVASRLCRTRQKLYRIINTLRT